MGTTGSRTRASARGARSAVLGIAGIAALWWFVATVFSSDRGLDLTDEGLYLLALDPPSPEAGWVTPFGWSTSPLFDLVGHDIARTRTLAVVLLVVVGGAMGAALARWSGAGRWGRWGVAAIGALGAPLLTAGFLRTPGYNWANLVGLMLGLTGIALAGTAPLRARRRWFRRVDLHVAAAVLAAGCIVAVPAKPSSGIVLIGVAVAVLWWTVDVRRAAQVAVLTAGWGTAWVAVCILTGRWSASFLSVLWASASFPPLHENQTIGGALHDLLRTPKVAAQRLAELRPAAIAAVAMAVVLTVVVRRAIDRGRRVGLALRCTPLALCAVAAVGTAVPWPVLGLPNPQFRFAWFGTTNAALLLLLGSWLHVAADPQHRPLRRAAATTVACGISVVAFAFGSAMSVFNQAALAAVLVLVAAGATVLTVGDASARQSGVVVLVAATSILVVSNVVDSRHHPYDYGDVAVQTTPLELGAHGDTLLVQADTAAHLSSLRAEAHAAGLCAGTPLIGLRWGWTATEPFTIGATVPDSLMLTIFGYPDAVTLLPVTMARLDGPAWHDAWLMTTDTAALDADQAGELQQAYDRLPTTVGRAFPVDYDLVADVDGTQLWRPVDVPGRPCG